MKTYLFSYGTLIPSLAPPRVIRHVSRLRRIGKGYVSGRLYDLGAYPGAVLGDMSSRIIGEVFEVPEERILLHLDRYEGFDPTHASRSEFVRQKAEVVVGGRKKLICWIYVYNRAPASARTIPDGDFVKHRK